MDFHQRKAARTEYYTRFVHGEASCLYGLRRQWALRLER